MLSITNIWSAMRPCLSWHGMPLGESEAEIDSEQRKDIDYSIRKIVTSEKNEACCVHDHNEIHLSEWETSFIYLDNIQWG
jgi:hypothetical protein